MEPDGDIIFANLLARGRYNSRTERELRAEARARWLHGWWLSREAEQYGLPVVEPRPWETLDERILAAITP